MVTKRTRWFRHTGMVLLVLVVLCGGSVVAGDLFDDGYQDCPHRTRLRDGQIADLTLVRDAEDESEVNVSWTATDPATWGLGPNAYRGSLVVMLDDGGNLATKTLSLGMRQATFDEVATGVQVTAQMAIVVDTAMGAYLISDILSANVNQSLTTPSFSTEWSIRHSHPSIDNAIPSPQDIPLPDWGRMYYIGYNANFGNYRAGEGLTLATWPFTPTFRIGLAHGGEDDDARDEVKFDAYLVRLRDADGDVVPAGDDVATVVSDYGQGGAGDPAEDLGYDKVLVLDWDVTAAYGDLCPVPCQTLPEQAAQNRANLVADGPFVNVRINDGGAIAPPMYQSEVVRTIAANNIDNLHYSPTGKIAALGIEVPDTTDVYALPPDAHRDFPIGVLASDQTHTIEAWAVNEDGEVISPKATLKVHSRAPAPTMLGAGPARFQDYLNPPAAAGTLLTTEFTVVK